MNFIIFDIIFLVVFTLLVALFLYTRKHNLKREGIMYLYRTQVGLRIIEWTAKKYARILKPMQYLVVTSGYVLMAAMIFFLARFSYIYLTSSTAAQVLRVPVLTPLIPYIDKLFGQGYFPPFYFTYWIIAIAIIAVSHEFAHGIFARLNKVRILSTGFGFLGPFLAAFVEQDDKQMQKAKRFPQLAIIAAGTFANVLMTILFGIILWIFFIATFSPAGVTFDTYATSLVNVSEVIFVEGIALQDLTSSSEIFQENLSFLDVTTNNYTYYTTPAVLLTVLAEKRESFPAYENSPAFISELEGAIKEINGEKITTYSRLREIIQTSSPGDVLDIKTQTPDKTNYYSITLAEKDGKAFLGIGKFPPASMKNSGFFVRSSMLFYQLLDPVKYNRYLEGIVYESSFGEFGVFIYNLLWWIILINISVALANMLPVGIFDGGRFFYLTIWSITGSKKVGEQAFKWATWVILALVVALMLKWFWVVIL